MESKYPTKKKIKKGKEQMSETRKPRGLGKECIETNYREEKFRLRHWEFIAFYLALYDIVAVNVSYFFGLLIRFDLRYSHIPHEYLTAFVKFAPFYTAFVIIMFYVFRLYIVAQLSRQKSKIFIMN